MRGNEIKVTWLCSATETVSIMHRLLAAMRLSGPVDAPEDVLVIIDHFRGKGIVTQISRDELHRIAKTKSPRRAKLIFENSEESVENISRCALAEKDPLVQMNVLCALRGVQVPIGSAVLSWIKPTNWAVIDRFAWEALRERRLVSGCESGNGFTANHWLEYMSRVRQLAKKVGWTPQQVDIWLQNDGRRRTKKAPSHDN